MANRSLIGQRFRTRLARVENEVSHCPIRWSCAVRLDSSTSAVTCHLNKESMKIVDVLALLAAVPSSMTSTGQVARVSSQRGCCKTPGEV